MNTDANLDAVSMTVDPMTALVLAMVIVIAGWAVFKLAKLLWAVVAG